MSLNTDKIKLKLQSATILNLKIGKAESSLRSLERSLTEDISLVQNECDLMLQQIKGVANQINKTKKQISTIETCSVADNCKMDKEIELINAHKQRFEAMFAEERKIAELHKKDLNEREAELERQKTQQIVKEIAAVERECVAIEKECSVLTKRNRAMMLKLKRNLAEAVETRRRLMKNT